MGLIVDESFLDEFWYGDGDKKKPSSWWEGKTVTCKQCNAERVLTPEDADEINFYLGGCVMPEHYEVACKHCGARIEF